MLREWRWLVPADYRPVRKAAFGDWFFEAPGGSIHMLDLLEGEINAGPMRDFEELETHEDVRDEWYLEGLVARCQGDGMRLQEGECLGWRVHPVLGGSVAVENVQPFSVRVYQCLVAQLLREIRALKPGATISGIKLTKQ